MTCVKKKSLDGIYNILSDSIIDPTKTIEDFEVYSKIKLQQNVDIVYNGKVIGSVTEKKPEIKNVYTCTKRTRTKVKGVLIRYLPVNVKRKCYGSKRNDDIYIDDVNVDSTCNHKMEPDKCTNR